MMKKIGFALSLVLLFMMGSAYAQDYVDRKGFFLGFSLGGGSLNIDGGDYKEGAFLGGIRIGGGISENILLMAETNNAITDEDGVTVTHGSLNFAAQFFLNGNFYLRPGIGFASLQIDGDDGTFSFSATSDAGFNACLSAGYEFRLGKRFALSPEATFSYSSIEGSDVTHYGLKAAFQWYF
ncbi:MAG TPA: outer membrane beta-barrel protein [Oligoflexia bacterium]|nr:outer membrane beta-barrel protein [Oligoflexia bacterium]HMR25111.1 outer membrane beta-barrel protein [Oligoflexia bacterium]